MVITLAKSMLTYHPQTTTPPHKNYKNQLTSPIIRASSSSSIDENALTGRRKVISTILTASFGLGLQATPFALAEAWGTRSYILEKYFQPGLSAEDAIARIKQSAEGLHSIREMLDTQSWRYVIFYIRLKQSYLNQDLRNVLSTIPESRRNEYVDNMAEQMDIEESSRAALWREELIEEIEQKVGSLKELEEAGNKEKEQENTHKQNERL